MERFIQRTWRWTSEKICLGNHLPPGFRIVLLDENGRARRDDLLVWVRPEWGAWDGGIRVWAFLENAISVAVKDDGAANFCEAQLRDHRNRPISPNATLRGVRDMPGARGRHSETWEQDQDIIDSLEGDIEAALEIFDDDPHLEGDPKHDRLLKALIHYVVRRFDIDALEYGLHIYKEELRDRSRREE